MKSDNEMEQKRLIAQRLFIHERGHLEWREDCGACALEGYISRATRKESDGVQFVNYVGWLRVYVQAGRIIPARWFMKVRNELKSDNKAYLRALQEDIKYYGVQNQEPGIKTVLELFKDAEV